MFVDFEFHRNRIGRVRMERARALRSEVEVGVLEGNVRGRAFYASLGFELMHQSAHHLTGFGVMRLRSAAVSPLHPTGFACG
jgi:hypothetical protein